MPYDIPIMPRYPANPNRKGMICCDSFAEAYRATLPSEPYYVALVSNPTVTMVKNMLNELSERGSCGIQKTEFDFDTPIGAVTTDPRTQEMIRLWLSLGLLNPDYRAHSSLSYTVPFGLGSMKRWHVDAAQLISILPAFEMTEFAVDPVSGLPYVAESGGIHEGYKIMAAPTHCAVVLAKKNGFGPVHRTPLTVTKPNRLILSRA